MLDHPFRSLLFDIEQNHLWWRGWGERPRSSHERAEILRSILSQAATLVPLVSHRSIPSEPYDAGNPMFSIMGAATIIYGANLEGYFKREFSPFGHEGPVAAPVRHIPFWSDLVERNA
jgi:hypothetical protein